MQLITANIYDYERDDVCAAFTELIDQPPEGLVILEGNAGKGADWPVGIVRSAQALAVAWAVFSAPNTFEENWPIWKEIYDETRRFVIERFGDVRVDRDSAQMIALHHAIQFLSVRPDEVEIHMAFRQSVISGVGSYEDLLNSKRITMEWPDFSVRGDKYYLKGVESLDEAAKQTVARYFFGISDISSVTSLVVEMNGSVSFSGRLEV